MTSKMPFWTFAYLVFLTACAEAPLKIQPVIAVVEKTDTVEICNRLGYNPFLSNKVLQFVDTAHVVYKNKELVFNEMFYQFYYAQVKIGIKHVHEKPFESGEKYTANAVYKNGELYFLDGDYYPYKRLSDSAKNVIIKKLIK